MATRRRSGWLIAVVTVALVTQVAVAWAVASRFDDVPPSNPFVADIEWVADAGVTLGCADGSSYCPTDFVTRQQMAAFMHRLAVNQVVDAASVQGLEPADLMGGSDDRYYTKTEVDALLAPLTNSVAAFAGGNQSVDLTSVDQVVRSVSLMPPADGTVVVTSSADLWRRSGSPGARCSITTGTSLDFAFLQISAVPDVPGTVNDFATIAGTRGFPVSEGVLFTANLVCDEYAQDVDLEDSAMTAIFAPT